MRRHASAQAAHLRLEAIAGGMLHLPGGQYRAVLEVEGVPFAFLEEARQEAVLAGYAAFLQGLTFPVQVLVRQTPADLAPYLERLDRTARQADPGVRALAQDHAAFVRQLVRRRTLLERRCYLVVPAEDVETGPWGLLWSWWPFRRQRAAAPGAEVARQRLGLRCAEVGRELARCGLAVRRLEDGELAQLLFACWCPDRARRLRLGRDLHDYTTLVVEGSKAAQLGMVPGPKLPTHTHDPRDAVSLTWED